MLHPFGTDVGSVVPDIFPAYARVLHPVIEDGVRRTWAEIAIENERLVHPEMQLHEISRSRHQPPPDRYHMDDRVEWGSLPRPELEALRDLLAPHTTTSGRAWCCIWEGYGQLRGGDIITFSARKYNSAASVDDEPPIAPREVLHGPRVTAPKRAYYLLCGPLSDLVDLYEDLGDQSPNVWWPDDREWIVATEIDLAWTYVAGSKAAAAAVLAHPLLEAVPATPNDQFTYDSDVLNRRGDQ